MAECTIPLVDHGPFGNGHSTHASRALRAGQQAYRAAPVSRPDARVRHEAALADLTAMVLQSTDVADAERAAVAVLQALFDADLVLVLRLLPDKTALSLESGTDGAGWLPPGMVIGVEGDSDEDRVLRSPNPILARNADGSAESIPILRDRGVTDGVLARIQGEHGPWGLLGVYWSQRVSLNEVDVHFVRAVANALAASIMYKRAQSTLDNLIADSSDPVARFDRDLRVEYANAAMVAATGCASNKLVGRTFRALGLMDAQLDGLEAIVGAVLRSGREREAAFSLTSPLGVRHYSVRFVPELATDRSVSSVLAMARDVTEHKRVDDERAFLQQELVARDTRHEDFVQLLTDQQRSNVQEATASYRSEIISQLTSREREILRLLTGGLTNRQIARRLHLSAGTVKNHLGRVFPKLDAIDRTQAAVRAIELGLVATPEA